MTPQFAAFLANVVLLVHFALVAFVVGGLVLVWLGGLLRWGWVRNFWFRLFHLLLVTVIVLESVFGVICPLTKWERRLRECAGDMGAVELERQGFIIYYVSKILFFPTELEWDAKTLMRLYVGFGVLVVLSELVVPPYWPRFRRRLDTPATSHQAAG